MNIEIKNSADFASLTTKTMWRKWLKAQAFSFSAFSVSYLEDFLKHHSKPHTVWGAFQSLSPEPQIQWQPLAEKFGIQWAFPKLDELDSKACKMDFYLAEEFKAHSKYEMLEPSGDAQAVKPAEMAGILVPGLVFDNRGFRLGRGKGYYDRYLTDYQGLKVGLCNHDLFVLRPLPKENWDVRMDYVVTDEFVFSVG